MNFCFPTSADLEMRMQSNSMCWVSTSEFIISVYKFIKGNVEGYFDREAETLYYPSFALVTLLKRHFPCIDTYVYIPIVLFCLVNTVFVSNGA